MYCQTERIHCSCNFISASNLHTLLLRYTLCGTEIFKIEINCVYTVFVSMKWKCTPRNHTCYACSMVSFDVWVDFYFFQQRVSQTNNQVVSWMRIIYFCFSTQEIKHCLSKSLRKPLRNKCIHLKTLILLKGRHHQYISILFLKRNVLIFPSNKLLKEGFSELSLHPFTD